MRSRVMSCRCTFKASPGNGIPEMKQSLSEEFRVSEANVPSMTGFCLRRRSFKAQTQDSEETFLPRNAVPLSSVMYFQLMSNHSQEPCSPPPLRQRDLSDQGHRFYLAGTPPLAKGVSIPISVYTGRLREQS